MGKTNGGVGLDARTLMHIRSTARRIARTGSLPSMDVEDIEQDLILDLWQRRGAFDPCRATFRTFADRIVAHRVATLTRPTTRLRAERELASLDAPIGGDDEGTLADALADPDTATDIDAHDGLKLDVRRFVAGLTPAQRRCCDILLAPDVREATARAGLHHSSVYENARRLKKLAEAAGLKDYLADTQTLCAVRR